jgi:hypothetical protein
MIPTFPTAAFIPLPPIHNARQPRLVRSPLSGEIAMQWFNHGVMEITHGPAEMGAPMKNL